MLKQRLWGLFIGMNGLIAVVISALVAHVFPFSSRVPLLYALAAHWIHVIVLLFFRQERYERNVWIVVATYLFATGIILFPWMVYIKHVLLLVVGSGAWERLSATAPYGGSALIFGWLFATMGLYQQNTERE